MGNLVNMCYKTRRYPLTSFEYLKSSSLFQRRRQSVTEKKSEQKVASVQTPVMALSPLLTKITGF